MSDVSPRRPEDVPDPPGLAKHRRRRSRSSLRLALLGALPVVAVIGACCVYKERSEVTVTAGGDRDAALVGVRGIEGSMEGDAGGDAGERATECTQTIVVDVHIGGVFTRVVGDVPGVYPEGAALVTGYSRLSDEGGKEPLLGAATNLLAFPYFAAEFDRDDLCSAEETSPSHLRLTCIGRGSKLVTLEYRIRNRNTIELTWDGQTWHSYGPPDEKMPTGTCATIETNLRKHDLKQLHEAYLNDGLSERCRASPSPRRKVPGTFVRRALPKGHQYYEWGKLKAMGPPFYGYCRDVTLTRLMLPPWVGPSQDLGLLFNQCGGPCLAIHLDELHSAEVRKLSGAEIRCYEGGAAAAYQLGDHLYVIEETRVRRVPLPCGVELDFRLTEFAKSLN